MNIKHKYVLPALGVLSLLSSCSNYQDVNTNIYGVTEEEYNKGTFKYGLGLSTVELNVLPIRDANRLQTTENITAGSYIGYFGQNNNWGGNIEASWNFTDARSSILWDGLYTSFTTGWRDVAIDLQKETGSINKTLSSMIDIVKVFAWLRTTDCFGPMVYSNAGKGELSPAPDSQEKVYRGMLADLDKDVETLLAATNKAVAAKYDLMYNGDVSRWVKLGNSLMLRLAVRVHFKDEALAREYITKALDASRGGVITATSEEARIGNSDKQKIDNGLVTLVDNYQETRAGATIWSYMDGFGDARLAQVMTKGTYNGVDDYYPVAPTSNQPKQSAANTAMYASKPKVVYADPMYLMRASEVAFLRAEAALYGLSSEDPGTLYAEGVKLSFSEMGASGADAYLAKSSGVPTSFSASNYHYGRYASSVEQGNVTPKWDDSATTEVKLQRIITQKYLALYPNAIEAWTEYRRTGYPLLHRPQDAQAPGRIGAPATARTPERYRFPASPFGPKFSLGDVEALLGGPDQGSTKLWWVRSNRPAQQ